MELEPVQGMRIMMARMMCGGNELIQNEALLSIGADFLRDHNVSPIDANLWLQQHPIPYAKGLCYGN